jgi:hypothetical protein
VVCFGVFFSPPPPPPPQDRANRIAEARENLGALGCTEVEEIPVADSPHLDGAQLAGNPPEAIYPDRPTTSGPHLANVAQSGFYDKVVDERLLVHNLEHGYVHIYFDEDAPEEDVAEIEEFVEGLISGNTQKVIASRWKADLPGDANYALTAWGARQTCEQWDQGVAEAFIAEHHYLEGTAPERTIQPHLGGTGSGIDPDEEDGDLLFPPLGEGDEVDVEDAMEEPEGVTEEGEEGPRDDEGVGADADDS